MKLIIPVSVSFVAMAVSLTAQPPTPHNVRVVENRHVSQLPQEYKELATLFLPTPRESFLGGYLMASQWYGVPKRPSAGEPGPVVIFGVRVGNPAMPTAITPDRQRPVIPPGATTRNNNETIVPLWMHFETAWKADGERPDKGCPRPVVRMQWRTASNSGGYMPLTSVAEGVTKGGSGLPDHGELRMFTVNHSNAYVIVSNRHDTDGFEVRLLALCGSQMWETLPAKERRIP